MQMEFMSFFGSFNLHYFLLIVGFSEDLRSQIFKIEAIFYHRLSGAS